MRLCVYLESKYMLIRTEVALEQISSEQTWIWFKRGL